MKIKNILLFAAGLLTGGAAGVLVTKKYFQTVYAEKADEEIAEMEAYYERKTEEIMDLVTEKELDEGENCQKTEKNDEKTTSESKNYAKIYEKRADLEEELTEEELEKLRDALEDVSQEGLSMAASEEHKRNRNRPPELISEEACGEVPPYWDNQVLFWYLGNNVITDDEDNVVDDPDYLLGDCLEQDDDTVSLIFVRNYALDTLYEIQKIEGDFEYE